MLNKTFFIPLLPTISKYLIFVLIYLWRINLHKIKHSYYFVHSWKPYFSLDVHAFYLMYWRIPLFLVVLFKVFFNCSLCRWCFVLLFLIISWTYRQALWSLLVLIQISNHWMCPSTSSDIHPIFEPLNTYLMFFFVILNQPMSLLESPSDFAYAHPYLGSLMFFSFLMLIQILSPWAYAIFVQAHHSLKRQARPCLSTYAQNWIQKED